MGQLPHIFPCFFHQPFQNEIDHINGILCGDKAKPESLMFVEVYRQLGNKALGSVHLISSKLSWRE